MRPRPAATRVITTLDWQAQQLARTLDDGRRRSCRICRRSRATPARPAEDPEGDRGWINALRGKDLHNGALVALDYRTGDVLAYVGSAGYDRDDLASRKFAPKYDVAGDGLRQPGSAFKPVLYASAFDHDRLTPGQPAPRRHDQVRVARTGRRATATSWTAARSSSARRSSTRSTCPPSAPWSGSATRQSPTRRTLSASGSLGGGTPSSRPGLAGALGTVEVRPLDLVSAYGALANGGVHVPPRMILKVIGPDGKAVWQAPEPTGKQAVSPQAAFLTTDILAGNTDPTPEPDLGGEARAPERHAAARSPGGGQDRDLERGDATSRRTASWRRRRPGSARASRSACGWATATTPTRGPRSPRHH